MKIDDIFPMQNLEQSSV